MVVGAAAASERQYVSRLQANVVVAMNPGECEVCGNPSSVHLTEVEVGSPVKHHYCWEHSPPEVRAKRPTPTDEVKIVEQMIAQLDTREMNEAEKAKFREE